MLLFYRLSREFHTLKSIMLERINLHSLWEKFPTATQIYADARLITTITLCGKLVEARIHGSGGIRVSDKDSVRLTTDLSQCSLPALKPPINEETLGQITSRVRQLFPENKRIIHRKVVLTLTTHLFEVALPGQAVQQGEEESASLNIEWGIQEKEEVQHHREVAARRNWKDLLEDLAPCRWLSERIEQSLKPLPVWPVPNGEIPVYWAPRAVAKICLPFLRSFEGDRLLSGNSCLNRWTEKEPLPFALEEQPRTAIDHEGFPTRTVLLFDGRRPRALLVDRHLAEAFSVDSTGHARRHSYRNKNEVLSWGIEIHSQGEALPSFPEWGLSVRDVDLLDFDPVTAFVSLRLKDARLLHQGKEGESIEPMVLQIPLLELLRSWRAFSSETQIYGEFLQKDGAAYLTEVKAPAALSPCVRLPGQVPPEHYWVLCHDDTLS